jgi:hypothetical protein
MAPKTALPCAHIYANIFSHMRTTVDLPDELLIAAKKLAAESRKTLREVFERSLRRELAQPPEGRRSRHRPIRWVTAKGGLPPGVDIRDRARMHAWIRGER